MIPHTTKFYRPLSCDRCGNMARFIICNDGTFCPECNVEMEHVRNERFRSEEKLRAALEAFNKRKNAANRRRNVRCKRERNKAARIARRRSRA